MKRLFEEILRESESAEDFIDSPYAGVHKGECIERALWSLYNNNNEVGTEVDEMAFKIFRDDEASPRAKEATFEEFLKIVPYSSSRSKAERY